MIRKQLRMLAIAAFTLAMISTSIAANPRLPGFILEDQYERKWKHSDFTSSLVVYVISDRSGYEYSRNWTDPLIKEYGKTVRFVPIADVRGVPGFLKGYIRGRFKGEFKYPILMDWEGTIATGIKFTEGYPNLLIVDSDRTILHAVAGEGTERQVESFRTRLKAMIKR